MEERVCTCAEAWENSFKGELIIMGFEWQKGSQQVEMDTNFFLPFPQECHSCLHSHKPGCIVIARVYGGPAYFAVSGMVYLASLIPVAINPLGESKWWQVYSCGSARSPPTFCRRCISLVLLNASGISILFQFRPSGYILATIPTQLEFSVGLFLWAKFQLKPCGPAWQRGTPSSLCLGSNTLCSTIFCVDVLLILFRPIPHSWPPSYWAISYPVWTPFLLCSGS